MSAIVLGHYDDLDDQNLTVGVSPVPFPAPSASFNGGTGLISKTPDNIMVQADPGNSGVITLGKSVTGNIITTSNRAIQLPPGATLNLPVNKLDFWWAIATSGGNKLNILYMAGIT